jgi:AraC-like DNA-binding protein
MSFLYVVFFTQNRSWKWYDFLHFIPVMIYIVDYWNIFMLSGEEKKLLIQQGLSDLDFLREFRDSRFFGPHFHWEFRTAQFSLYLLAEVAIFVKWLRIQGPLTRQIVQRRNWILVFLCCHLAMVIVHYLSLFATIDLLIISGLFVTLGTSITLVIFFYPSILYGSYLSEKSQLRPKIQSQVKLNEEDKQKMEEMYLRMEAFLEEKKNFLNEGYTVHDFSQDIVIPPYQISKILRTVLNIGFVDYINQKRIKYCIDKLDQETWNTYTLEAVATECGFSNRNTFTQAFIKFQGETPSMYRSKVKKIKRS